jgi:hypothetical protein
MKSSIWIPFSECRGCPGKRVNMEYTGAMSNTEDDERCIKVELRDIVWSAVEVDAFNDQRKATYGGRYQDLVITGYNGKYTPRKVGEGLIHPPDSDYCKNGGSDCAKKLE